MIAGGRDLIVVAPWVSLAPGIALVLTVLATHAARRCVARSTRRGEARVVVRP